MIIEIRLKYIFQFSRATRTRKCTKYFRNRYFEKSKTVTIFLGSSESTFLSKNTKATVSEMHCIKNQKSKLLAFEIIIDRKEVIVNYKLVLMID